VADAALAQGGDVVGVIPQSLVEREVAHKGLSDLRIVGSMHERKALMAELSDGFIALPGGIGTLEELFEVWTWAQLGHHAKPCGLLNVSGFYDGLSTFIEHMVEERFLRPPHRNMLIVADSSEAMLAAIRGYKPPKVAKWLDREAT
jgi:uncharacterized protein (TIGR00730 family)